MHLKDYHAHSEKYRLKGNHMKDPKILLRIVRRTYNKYTKYTKKQHK